MTGINRTHVFRSSILAMATAVVLSGCAADYDRLAAPQAASDCAAWLTGAPPRLAPPRVDIVDGPIDVNQQPALGAAYRSLDLVRVQRGSAQETAERLVHEMAHIYGADEAGAEFAERNAWRCALG